MVTKEKSSRELVVKLCRFFASLVSSRSLVFFPPHSADFSVKTLFPPRFRSLFALSDPTKLRSDLQAIYDRGIRCLAICLTHSYTFPQHEQIIADIASEIGFTQISVSSTLSPQIKMVPRASSASADAYLSPVLQAYIAGFFKGFDDQLKSGKSGARVEFMTSEGTLVDVNNFSGLKSIISGPAGGVVGFASTSWDEERKIPVIGELLLFPTSSALKLCLLLSDEHSY